MTDRATAPNRRSRKTSATPVADGGRGHTVYLYRGLLRCGVCVLRMWGNHRRVCNYYSC